MKAVKANGVTVALTVRAIVALTNRVIVKKTALSEWETAKATDKTRATLRNGAGVQPKVALAVITDGTVE